MDRRCIAGRQKTQSRSAELGRVLGLPSGAKFKKKVTVQLTEGTSVTLTQPEWHSPPGVGRQAKVSGKVEVQAACSPHLAPPDPTGTNQSRPHVYLAPALHYENRAPHVAAD